MITNVNSVVEDDYITKKLYIKIQNKDNCSVPYLHCEGIIYTDHLQKTESFNKYFSSELKFSSSSFERIIYSRNLY